MLNQVQSKCSVTSEVPSPSASANRSAKRQMGLGSPAVFAKCSVAAIGLIFSPQGALARPNVSIANALQLGDPAAGAALAGRRLLDKPHLPARGGSIAKQTAAVSYENQLVPGNAPAKVLDAGTTVPSNLVIKAPVTGPAQIGQLFTVPIDGPGPISLTNDPSNGPQVCLDVPAGNYTSTVLVQAYDCNGGQNQQWVYVNNTIRPVGSPHLCLDVTAFGSADGSPVQLYGCNNGTNQAWSLNQIN